MFSQLEKYEQALADTDASLALCSTSFKALRTRARINMHLEKFEAAIADFNSAIEQAGVEGNDNDVRALRSELKKAEAALKRSKTKDYYKILGVPRDCDEADIKKAYRRESLKHHPDKVGIALRTLQFCLDCTKGRRRRKIQACGGS
jgi:DnaJ family protein C protein 7